MRSLNNQQRIHFPFLICCRIWFEYCSGYLMVQMTEFCSCERVIWYLLWSASFENGGKWLIVYDIYSAHQCGSVSVEVLSYILLGSRFLNAWEWLSEWVYSCVCCWVWKMAVQWFCIAMKLKNGEREGGESIEKKLLVCNLIYSMR